MLIAWYPKNGGMFSSQKMKKRNKTDFYRAMLLMYSIWRHWNILLQGLHKVQKSLWISSHFETENYAWRLDIVFFSDILRNIVQKLLKQFSLQRLDIVQNFFCTIFWQKIFKITQHIKTWYSLKLASFFLSLMQLKTFRLFLWHILSQNI